MHKREVVPSMIVLTLFMGLMGCAPEDAQRPGQASPNVVMPGKAGDQPRTATSAELDAISRSPRPNQHELHYVRQMIPHHEQALVMTDLVPQRGDDGAVRALAARIAGAQAPEVEAMRAWSARHTARESGHSHGSHGQHQHGGDHGQHHHVGHHQGDHADMPGMATPAQLARLKSLRGTEFDQLFLKLMITHHEGAVTMATDLLANGGDQRLHEMAQDVLVTQQDEIATMKKMGSRLRS